MKHRKRAGQLALKTGKPVLNSHQRPDKKDGVEIMTGGILAEIRQHTSLGGQAGSSSSGKHCFVLATQSWPSPPAPITRSCGGFCCGQEPKSMRRCWLSSGQGKAPSSHALTSARQCQEAWKVLCHCFTQMVGMGQEAPNPQSSCHLLPGSGCVMAPHPWPLGCCRSLGECCREVREGHGPKG